MIPLQSIPLHLLLQKAPQRSASPEHAVICAIITLLCAMCKKNIMDELDEIHYEDRQLMFDLWQNIVTVHSSARVICTVL